MATQARSRRARLLPLAHRPGPGHLQQRGLSSGEVVEAESHPPPTQRQLGMGMPRVYLRPANASHVISLGGDIHFPIFHKFLLIFDIIPSHNAPRNFHKILVLKGPNTFFPLAWVSTRQTSVSRSTTESEIVSLAHSSFQEALPALQLWQTILDYPIELVIHEDNQATILVAKKGYSPKLRHIACTHKVNLGSIAEVLDEDDVKLHYVETNSQAADIFTKALAPQKWDNALRLLGMRQKLPEVLVDVRQLKTKAGSGPTTVASTSAGPK